MAEAASILDAQNADEALAAVKSSGSSFLIGMAAAEPKRRQAMYGLYAFCRAVDDIADSDWPREQRLAELQKWRGYVKSLFQGKAAQPVMELLHSAVADFALAEKDFHDIIEGMEMDAREDIQAPSMETLDHYCDCVASAVGRVSVRIFGQGDEAGQKLAHHLGRALQLTNILRDLDEDASRGRLYLPKEIIEETGIPSFSPLAVLAHPALDVAARLLARQAFIHFNDADEVMEACNSRAVKPARLMRDYYEKLLYKQLVAGWKPPRLRVGLTPWEKALLFLKAYL